VVDARRSMRTDDRAVADPRTAIKVGIDGLFPGSFALVMATGIVSIAAFLQGFEIVARVLLWVNVAAYFVLWVLTVVRAARSARSLAADVANHQRGAGFLSIVAATNVLGSQVFVIEERTGIALALWIAGLVAWVVITYAFLTAVTVRAEKPTLDRGINGAWLLLVVSTESIAVLGALLAASTGSTPAMLAVALFAHLVGLMLYVVVIGLIVYRWTFFPLTGDQVTPPYWINMGALAIAALAGANLLAAAGSWDVLGRVEPFVVGTTLLAWGFATWWIPLLLAVGLWRHGVQRVPVRYDPQYWSLVFPIGMYSVATFRMLAAIDVGVPEAVATTAFWVSIGAWAVTAVGLLGTSRALIDTRST
jgi:tellurite resistance protein TehA-like permease